jgi:hypothetical protein
MVQVGPDGKVYAFVVGAGLLSAAPSSLEWQTLSNDLGERVLLHLAMDPGEPARMFAVVDGSVILASPDGGKSWSPWGQN